MSVNVTNISIYIVERSRDVESDLDFEGYDIFAISQTEMS